MNGAAKETVQPFALSLQTSTSREERKAVLHDILLSEQKTDTRQEEGILSNVKHAHFE